MCQKRQHTNPTLKNSWPGFDPEIFLLTGDSSTKGATMLPLKSHVSFSHKLCTFHIEALKTTQLFSLTQVEASVSAKKRVFYFSYFYKTNCA